MGNLPAEAWGFFGLVVGSIISYLTTRSTNAATIAQKNRQDDRDYVTRILEQKELECQHLRDDIRAERELRALEQARADRYLVLLLEDEQAMSKAAVILDQQTGGAA